MKLVQPLEEIRGVLHLPLARRVKIMHTICPRRYQQQLITELHMDDPPEPTLEDRLLYLEEAIDNVADDIAAIAYLMQAQAQQMADLVSLVEEAIVAVLPEAPSSSLPLQ